MSEYPATQGDPAGTPDRVPERPPPAAEPKRTERPHPLTPLVRGWIVLVAIALGFGRDILQRFNEIQTWANSLWWVLGAIGVAVVLAFLAGLASWYFTRFVIDEQELRVETGWIIRTSKQIAFNRVQSIDVVQPLTARIFGLAELDIDAGADSRTKLRYLSRARAVQLRDYLLVRAHGQRAEVSSARPTTTAGLLEDAAPDDVVLVRIPPQRLLIATLLSHEFWLSLLGVAVATAIGLYFGQVIVGLAAAVPAITALFGFVSKRVLAQFNYTLARSGPGLRITRGLTSLTSQSVPSNRIQGIRIAQPILWQPLNLFRVDIDVLGMGRISGDEDSASPNTILMPAGTAEQVGIALHAIWPGVDLADVPMHVVPERARWFRPFAAHKLRYGTDERVSVTESGLLIHVTDVIPHARVQSVRLEQGPLQRRLRLADVGLHTAGGVLNCVAKHLDQDAARAFALAQLRRSHEARVLDLTMGDRDVPSQRQVWHSGS